MRHPGTPSDRWQPSVSSDIPCCIFRVTAIQILTFNMLDSNTCFLLSFSFAPENIFLSYPSYDQSLKFQGTGSHMTEIDQSNTIFHSVPDNIRTPRVKLGSEGKMFRGIVGRFKSLVVNRAATIHSPHDTICIAILASRYDTYRDTLFRLEIISNRMRILLWCSPYFKVCLKWFISYICKS